jgi:hypothetical protein
MQNAVLWPVALYKCEILALAVEKKCMQVFANRISRNTFRPKKDEVTELREKSYFLGLPSIVRVVKCRRL